MVDSRTIKSKIKNVLHRGRKEKLRRSYHGPEDPILAIDVSPGAQTGTHDVGKAEPPLGETKKEHEPSDLSESLDQRVPEPPAPEELTADVTDHVPPSSERNHTVDTDVTVSQAKPVTHETVHRQTHHVREEQITKEIHYHHVVHRVLPVIDTSSTEDTRTAQLPGESNAAPVSPEHDTPTVATEGATEGAPAGRLAHEIDIGMLNLSLRDHDDEDMTTALNQQIPRKPVLAAGKP